jgi:hypothetical protein
MRTYLAGWGNEHTRVASHQQASGCFGRSLPANQLREEGYGQGEDVETGHDRRRGLVLTNVGVEVDGPRGRRFTGVVGVPSVQCHCGHRSEPVRMIVRDGAVRGIKPELEQGVWVGEPCSRPVVARQEQHAQERQTPEERAQGNWGKDLATSQRADRYFLGSIAVESSAVRLSSGASVSRGPRRPERLQPTCQPR